MILINPISAVSVKRIEINISVEQNNQNSCLSGEFKLKRLCLFLQVQSNQKNNSLICGAKLADTQYSCIAPLKLRMRLRMKWMNFLVFAFRFTSS